MKSYNLEFPVNADTKFIVNLEEPMQEVHCCYEAPVILTYQGKTFNVIEDSVREVINNFKCIAEKALRNELHLHKSITQDLGFLLNEDLQFKPNLFQVPNGTSTWWVGYKYNISVGNKLGTWLYNDSQGNIIFEATPIFPFSYRNYAKDPNYIPYKKWIKNYEPYFVTEASKPFIKEWVVKADLILNQIEQNIVRLHAENKI